MKALVLYASEYGNTEKVAHTIAKNFRDAVSLSLNHASASSFTGYDLVIVGSPTQGGQPTKSLQAFFQTRPKNSLKNLKVAAFDTSFDIEKQKFALKLLMKAIGYAAPKILTTLEKLGGEKIAKPEIFIVTDTKGPLAEGELERAAAWARSLDQ